MPTSQLAPNLVLVDDDQNILTSISLSLEAEGFNVRTYSNSEDALRELTRNPANLAVLDIKMPRMTGMELLDKLRHTPATATMPVIFLTSKDEEIDEIMGLRMGADDYIRKPFSQKLLIERIRSLLRREQARQQPASGTANSVLVRGEMTLDASRHLITWKGKDVDLTVTEFLLVKALATHPGHVKTRDQLMDVAYDDSVYVDDRTIDSHIKRLRKKFKEVDQEFSQIETLYGVGYKFKDA